MNRASFLAVATAAVLTSGCSDDGANCRWENIPEPSAVEGEKQPVEIQPSQTLPGLTKAELDAVVPVPDGFPPINEQVLVGLRRDTLEMAGAVGEVGAGRCDGDVAGSVGSTTRCTVTYEGVEVRWLVEITGIGTPIGKGYEYSVRPLSSVHTAQDVYDSFAWETGKDGQQSGPQPTRAPRCERLPDVFAAEPGQDTGYSCQDIKWFCENGDHDFRWSDRPIEINDDGNVTFGPL
ncbi:MAG: hypothetical protein M0026_12975 [Nocardiopsaceae bacterium]|nr:hypothetical protein [Nocardiopsaceae bacterium]